MRISLPCLLVVLCLAGIARGQDPQPNAPNSHEAFVKLLNASRKHTRQDIIARYDAYLAASPSDHLTAIERCKFILDNVDDEDDEDDEDPTGKTCTDALEASHGKQPAVVLYRLSTMWGATALDYGSSKLADSTIRFKPSERASVLGSMADRQHGLKHLKEASQLGEAAQQQDPTYDATFLIADYLRSIGQRQRALDVVSARISDDHDGPRLLQKARLLSDLDDPARALTAIRAASTIDGVHVDAGLQAHVLEALGDTEGARAAYGKQVGWNRREVLTRLFYLDLGKKNVAAATASYRELRDLGWRADRLGRHRLALTLEHPGAKWMFRELIGPGGLLAMILFVALLPASIALPVHYVGLLRRARGAPEVDSRWKLRHAWIASSLMLVAGLLAIYGFAYEELDTILDGHGKANLSQVQLARAGVASFTFTALAAISFTRRSDWQGLAPTAWLNRATLGTAAKYFLLLLVVGWLNRRLILSFAEAAPAGEGIALSTLAILRAIRSTYGAITMLFFAVVTTPLAEEFLFRGVILGALGRHIPFWWANVLQACLFALMHDDLKMLPFLIVLALLAGVLRRRTQSLATGTVLHSLNNLVASLAISS